MTSLVPSRYEPDEVLREQQPCDVRKIFLDPAQTVHRDRIDFRQSKPDATPVTGEWRLEGIPVTESSSMDTACKRSRWP